MIYFCWYPSNGILSLCKYKTHWLLICTCKNSSLHFRFLGPVCIRSISGCSFKKYFLMIFKQVLISMALYLVQDKDFVVHSDASEIYMMTYYKRKDQCRLSVYNLTPSRTQLIQFYLKVSFFSHYIYRLQLLVFTDITLNGKFS